ncbi:MAG: hypothetical protein A2X36_05490 [Elusimicrobia bacterium GWA2_69_24]|nr:MAG: hypothetical protein A2X36_05490 [Elusimicrobia bacterium GWA2_69_24]
MTESAAAAQESTSPFRFNLRPRRGKFLRVKPETVSDQGFFEDLDLVYRTLCGVLYNFVPTSGHPGGSVSSGRIVSTLLFESMGYDFSDPDCKEADQLVYAAGHKALGLYAMWALRNELVRIAKPEALPAAQRQLRLEDLLGFRRNPTSALPLFKKLGVKALDGHPTPAIPFVPIATGASGVGLTAGLGVALGAADAYGRNGPRVHLLEGEGGMTPGRVQEGLAAAATMGLENAILHVDWNQSSIDSDRVCPEADYRGQYVQWNPLELLRLHDWNVVYAGDGHDLRRVFAAQHAAAELRNGQPTAVVYRTVKGWHYGIEGRKSHGSGHAFCSDGYYASVSPFEERFRTRLPKVKGPVNGLGDEKVERAYFDTLMVLRKALEGKPALARRAVERLRASAERLKASGRAPRTGGPRLDLLYSAGFTPDKPPPKLVQTPGASVTIRGALGDMLDHLNQWTNGAFLGCAADLAGSTSLSQLNAGFPGEFFHIHDNPGSRLISVGGICEDAMGGFMAGVSSYGRHIGVSSSYAAFIAALEHVPARLHAIGQAARRGVTGEPYQTWIMLNAHAGSMTGEDGPTHADPQALQLLQDNFPKGSAITLTPWEPQEVWPLMIAGLLARPAVLCPFIPRPAVAVPDRQALGLPAAYAAVKGMYALRRAPGKATVVLQGTAVVTLFVREVLPKLDERGVKLNVMVVSSAELFDLLPAQERAAIYSEELARHAMGITDFTLATMTRWVRSGAGLDHSLHPFRGGHFLGSGNWDAVLKEGGLDGESQLNAVLEWHRLVEGAPHR